MSISRSEWPQEADNRFLKFREQYTTNEHLMSLYEGVKANAAISAVGFDMMDGRLREIGGGLTEIAQGVEGMSWAIEEGFGAMAEGMSGLQTELSNGFSDMQESFTWGISRLCWEHEQDRQVYQDLLAATLRKHQTDSLAYRQDGERAITNRWWLEAVQDLEKAVELYRYDYLAHLQLGRVQWLQLGQWEPALHHFELAAKYADVADAGPEQAYYAALAYAHTSMLWRMDAQSYPERAQDSLSKAATAASRATRLAPSLAVAVEEQALALLDLPDQPAAGRALDAAARADERLIIFMETSPDLSSIPYVLDFTRGWREMHASTVDSARTIIADARSLVMSYAPGQWKELPPFAALAGDLKARGTTPLSTVAEATQTLCAVIHEAHDELYRNVSRLRLQAQEMRRQLQTHTAARETLIKKGPEQCDLAPFPVMEDYLAGDEYKGCMFIIAAPLAFVVDIAILPFQLVIYAVKGIRARKRLNEQSELAAGTISATEDQCKTAEKQLQAAEMGLTAYETTAEDLQQRIVALRV